MDAPRSDVGSRNVDQVVLDALFRDNLPKLEAFLRLRASDRLLAQESVRDLAQSVCREFLADAASFDYRGEEALRKLLFLHAARKLVDRERWYRRARRDARRRVSLRQGESNGPQSRVVDAATPSLIVEAKEQLARFERALRALPPEQREAVALHRLAGMSYAEVAAALVRSEASVRGLVARGLARVTSILRDDGAPEQP